MYDPTSNVWSILQNTDVLGFTSAVSFKEGIYLVRHERYNISLYKYDFDKKELLSCAEYHNACDTDQSVAHRNFPVNPKRLLTIICTTQ